MIRIKRAWYNKKINEIHFANFKYPKKKLFGIHRDAMRIPPTIRNLAHQHPSWKAAAHPFLARQIQKTIN